MATQQSGPGKSYREGLTLLQAVEKFGDDKKAEAWFVSRRWPNGIRCPYCEGDNISPRADNRKTPAYRCNPCKRQFTVKTDTIMHDSIAPEHLGHGNLPCDHEPKGRKQHEVGGVT